MICSHFAKAMSIEEHMTTSHSSDATQATIRKLEKQIDDLKEVVMQIAWELEMRNKHRYVTKKEEEFLQKRNIKKV